MIRLGVMVMLSVLLASSTVDAAPSVHALYLPKNVTIKPEAERAIMAAGGDAIAASVSASVDERERVVIWRRGGAALLKHVPSGSTYQELGAVTSDGTVYVDSGVQDYGAMQPVFWSVLAYRDAFPRAVSFANCGLSGYAIGAPLVEAGSGMTLGLNFGMGYPPDFDSIRAGKWPPHAALSAEGACRVIGTAIVRGMRGRFAAGFRGYLQGEVVPPEFDSMKQRFVAVMWRDGAIRELGEGVALGVSPRGICVGATALPGHPPTEEFKSITTTDGQPPITRTWHYGVPRAALWRSDGTRVLLASGRSVAYAIDEGGRVVGTLQDPAGKHYAFVWHDGTLRKLDDIIYAPHWRFESAYAFTPDGGILGIGTHDGVSTAFIVHL